MDSDGDNANLDDTIEDLPDPASQLLHSARHGEVTVVKALLDQKSETSLNINCKGRNKANYGWTPLHLACYFGHTEVVEQLIYAGADVNVQNTEGDTPLHRAAFTGRMDVVTTLLKSNADVSKINAEGHTAKRVTRDQEIKSIIDAAETSEQRKLGEQLLQAAREGNLTAVSQMLASENPPNINTVDKFGNTALHCASYMGKKEVAIFLIQSGVDTGICNTNGQTALDLAKNAQMKQLLDVRPIRDLQRLPQRFEGPLLKRTRVWGWKTTWVVLERGVLSIFRNRADSTTGSRRKGSKYLNNSTIHSRSELANQFSVEFGDNTTYTFCVDQCPGVKLTKQKWETAIGEHIVYSGQLTNGLAISDDEEQQDIIPLGSMSQCLQTAEAHHKILEKQITLVTQSIQELSGDENRLNLTKQVALVHLKQQLNQIADSSRDMTCALSHCMTLFTQQEESRRLKLQQETEKVRVLQNALHVLAEEQYQLEKSLARAASPLPDGAQAAAMFESDEEEFYDCADEGSSQSSNSLQTSPKCLRNQACNESGKETVHQNGACLTTHQHSPYGRCRLPTPMFSRHDFSVWSILKQCIGKELSKITMPVVFNEPLSFLQRIVEYMEYSALLQKASDCDDPVQRLEYVTAFAVSATASNWDRIGKPFNPLLGETYQLVRDELGFRIVCEQVSHHPPVSAFHVNSPLYTFHGSIHPKLKFWGKSVEVTPKGLVTLHLLKHDEVYTWQNVNCCVHNIIVGKLWVEHYGTVEVINHKTKHKAVLNFKPSGWFGKDLHKIEGCLYDKNKKKLRNFYGKWVEAFYSYDVDVFDATISLGCDASPTESHPEVPDDAPIKGSSHDLKLPGQRLLWQAAARPDDSNQYYAFTLFAMMLNELHEGERESLPPTDSRLRPDMRKMEEGDIDGAALEKNRLEEKQRGARKERKKRKEEWSPLWFKLEKNRYTDKEDWIYNDQYWKMTKDEWAKKDPDIF